MNKPSSPTRTLARFLAPALLLALLAGAAHAQTTPVSDDLQDGVKLRGDGSVDDTQAGGPATAGSLQTKLDRLEVRRAKIETQRDRHLSGLAADDPQRAVIDARYDKKQAQVDVKQERIEARIVRSEDRGARVERSNRPERAERLDRPNRPERPDRPERGGRD